jgi:pilus assembly protein CpaC
MRRPIRVDSAILVLAVLLLAPSGKVLAQTTPEAQPLHILVGKSVIINMQNRVTRVLVSNPGIIDALATSPTQVVVDAKAAGTSSLILWEETGHTQMLDVMVDLDLSGLRSAIQEAYPHDTIQVQSDKGRIILSGSVKGQPASDDLMKMAGIYSKEIVNSLLIPPAGPARQVLLEVKIAEVDRTKLDQQAFNLLSTGATNTIGTVSTQQFGPPSGAGGGPFNLTTAIGAPPSSFQTNFGMSNLLNIFLFRPDINLGATIEALQQKTVLQILAEPNLMAVEGKKASFLAGGEFPFPVVQGGQNIGVVTIQFRPFGVKLEFTASISAGNIRLQVTPEVSTLDYSNAVTISGFTVPAISTRRADTEVELRDGQSFGIAGLLDQRAQALMAKIPGIGDLPVLGQLFRSKTLTRSNSELIVLVTPHLIDVASTSVKTRSLPAVAIPFMKPSKFDQDMPGQKELENKSQPTVPKENR